MSELLSGIKGLIGGISPLGLGLTAASTIFGAIKGGKANKANDNAINDQVQQNEARRGLQVSRNYMDTNHAQNVINQYRESLLQNQKQAAGRGAITGASDEATLAQNTNLQQGFNQAMGNVAAQGEQVQQMQEQQYLDRQGELNRMKMAINQGKAENAANLVANAGDMLNTMAFNSMFGKEPLDPGVGESVTNAPSAFQSAPLKAGTITEDNYFNQG